MINSPEKSKIRRIRSNDEVVLRDEDPYAVSSFRQVEKVGEPQSSEIAQNCTYYPERTIETTRDINTSLSLKLQMLEEKRKTLTSAPVGGTGMTRDIKPTRMVVFSSNVR